MDYYDLLGVNRNASQPDIKKAYKKQSMQHHPDRTGGDDTKFKEINEAYQVLSNPEKKQMYDQFGTADPQQAGFNPNMGGTQFHFDMGNGQGFEDVFSSFFGGNTPFRRQRQARNRDITIACEIELSDVYKGKGVIATFRTHTGKEQTVNIDIPVGAKAGDNIRFDGLGDDSIPQLPRGNLIVKIRYRRHHEYQVHGINLETTKNLNIFDLMCGTVVNLSTPEGRELNINVPAGTQPGTTMSLSGAGLPDYQTGAKGNIFLRLNGVVPKNLTEAQKEILKKIKDETNLSP